MTLPNRELLVGWDIKGLIKIFSSLNDRESNLLRVVIREKGIKRPEELIFVTSEEYKRVKGGSTIFFLNVKKALYENGLPYDEDTPEQIDAKIDEFRLSKNSPIRFTKLRFEILKRDNFTCKYCGRSPRNNKGVILHVDHIHPVSKRGEWIKENLITSCRECNLGKSDILLSEVSI